MPDKQLDQLNSSNREIGVHVMPRYPYQSGPFSVNFVPSGGSKERREMARRTYFWLNTKRTFSRCVCKYRHLSFLFKSEWLMCSICRMENDDYLGAGLYACSVQSLLYRLEMTRYTMLGVSL